MKKIVCVFIAIMVGISGLIYWSFFDISRLPKGQLISEVESPNGLYTIKAYLSDGGATTSYAILGELNYNNEKRKPKNIYWNYKEKTVNIEWINDNTIMINGHRLNVLFQTFDFRHSNNK